MRSVPAILIVVNATWLTPLQAEQNPAMTVKFKEA
jgi:hypothetical protein